MCCSLDVLERSTLGGTLFALCFLRCAGFHIPTVHANARAVHSRLSSLQDCDVCSELCRVGLEVGFTCHRQWFVSEHRVLLLTALSSESHLQRCWGTALWCPPTFCSFLLAPHWIPPLFIYEELSGAGVLLLRRDTDTSTASEAEIWKPGWIFCVSERKAACIVFDKEKDGLLLAIFNASRWNTLPDISFTKLHSLIFSDLPFIMLNVF